MYWIALATLFLSAQAPLGQAPLGQAPSGADLPAPKPLSAEAIAGALAASPLPDLPPSPGNRYADDERAAELGRKLFYDRKLSYAGVTSCASCHPPERVFTNGAMDFRGPEAVRRRVPTLLNVAYYPEFGWDGRADSLWSQALGPYEDITEQDGSRTGFVHRISTTKDLREPFEELFGPLPDVSDPKRFPAQAKPVPYHEGHSHNKAWVTMDPADQAAVTSVFVDMGKAVEAFQRRLVTGPAPFDRFVEDLRAGREAESEHLSASARRGLELFFGRANCVSCHSGPFFTDFAYRDTRVPRVDPSAFEPGRQLGLERLHRSPFLMDSDFADAQSEDLELAEPTARTGRFRTASLRVLNRPGGFFHEGFVPTLKGAIRYYSTLEGASPLLEGSDFELKPLNLTESEVDDLAAFLRSLQGQLADPYWGKRP